MPDETYHSGTIYRVQPSSSGQTMYVSTGCHIIDENVNLSTAADTLKNHGVSVMNTTHVRTIAAPYKGAHKKLIFIGTTKGQYAKCGGGATINNSTDDVINVVFGTTKAAELGFTVDLYGYSTALWYMGTVAPTSVAPNNTVVTLSSAT